MVRPIKFKAFFKTANFFFLTLGLNAFDFEHKERLKSCRDIWIYLIIVGNMFLSEMWLIINIVIEIRANHLTEAIMLGSYVGYVFVSVSKVLYLLSRQTELTTLMRRLCELFPKTAAQQLECSLPHYLQQCTRLSISFSALNVLLIWTYNLFAALQYWISERWLGLLAVGQQLPYFTLTPWEFRGHWSYYVLYAWNCLTGYAAMTGQMAANLLLFSVAIQVIMHYRHVARSIEEYEIQGGHSEGATAETTENDIKFICGIADYHEKVLSLSELMNDVFGLPLFLNFMTSSFIICFLGFEMTMGVSADMIFKLMLFLFASLTEAFLICWFAQELIQASENVANSVYNQKWYNAEVRYKKMLIFISVRARKTAFMKATHFLLISRGTMTDIMQMSYKFFALLRTMCAE